MAFNSARTRRAVFLSFLFLGSRNRGSCPSSSGNRTVEPDLATRKIAQRLERALLLGLALALPIGSSAQGDPQQLFFDGFELIKAGKVEAAAAKLELGLDSDPRNALAHYFLGEAYLAMGKKDRGAEEFRTSLDLDPKSQVSDQGRRRLTELSRNPFAGHGAQSVLPAAGEEFKDCTQCPAMIVVPAGESVMGSPAAEAGRSDDEAPEHVVTIAKPFAVGKYEVTFAEWDACVEDKHCAQLGKTVWGRRHHPVVNVSYGQAVGFTQWLSDKTGKKYRLLSEAEWEYAARGGSTSARFWGSSPDRACQFANVYDLTAKAAHDFRWENFPCEDGYANTAPVGSFEPNGFGLHDMLGNVWEWVDDCYNDSYAGAPRDGRVWRTGDCSQRVNRGGGWYGPPRFVRSAERDGLGSARGDDRVGLRVARTLP
jgi:formylglycine-generating enzyme required for sulfatase activity